MENTFNTNFDSIKEAIKLVQDSGLKIGSLVVLKSGGPIMTISSDVCSDNGVWDKENVYKTKYNCIWIDDNKIVQSYKFDIRMLKIEKA